MDRPSLFRLLCVAVLAATLSACDLAAGQLLAQFDLSVEPQHVSVAPGGSAMLTVGIEPVVGISFSRITVSLDGVTPDATGITAQDLVVFGAGEYPWSIDVAGNVPAGSYEIAVEAVSQGTNLLPVERRVKLTLTVE